MLIFVSALPISDVKGLGYAWQETLTLNSRSVRELMEYVDREARKRVKEILEKRGIEVYKFELKSGAPAGI